MHYFIFFLKVKYWKWFKNRFYSPSFRCNISKLEEHLLATGKNMHKNVVRFSVCLHTLFKGIIATHERTDTQDTWSYGHTYWQTICINMFLNPWLQKHSNMSKSGNWKKKKSIITFFSRRREKLKMKYLYIHFTLLNLNIDISQILLFKNMS